MCPLYTNNKELFQLGDSADANPPPIAAWISGDSRYLTPLLVHQNCHLSYLSQPENMSLELVADKIGHEKIQVMKFEAERIDPIQDKIAAALKLLTFRDQYVIVQFWSPHVIGKHQLLTTKDQPFGFGVTDQRLYTYRRDSEHNSYLLDNDHGEDDCSPVTRVFKQGLAEWSTDINHHYTLKQFPQQECANRSNLHGYLGLPVFDPTTSLCVGVLEVLMSSGYTDFAYEVQKIRDALQTVNLISPQVYDFPAQNVPNERRQNDLNKIYNILKILCEIHNLPLAQTWAVLQHSSFVAHEKVIIKSCSSFDTRCAGKVCMSTTANLPFNVKDLDMWPFLKACRERHLDKSRGLVGKALLTRCSCFSEDVTKLSEQEYPLVHDARMNGLTGCFAIFLHSVESGDDYVLEFFLPRDIIDIGQVRHLVQSLKQNVPVGSGFELGDTSSILTDLYTNVYSDVSQTFSDCVDDNSMNIMYTSDSESIDASATKTVTATIRFADETQIVQFPMSSRLSDLKIQVASIFELEGEIRLKYMDEENDEILIAVDDDLKSALGTTDRYNSINLICQRQPGT